MADFNFADDVLTSFDPGSTFADPGAAVTDFDFRPMTPAGGSDFELSSVFGPSSGFTLPDFGDWLATAPPLVAMPETLATGAGSGLSGLFADVTRLISTAYQGEAMVDQQRALNKIAQARLSNQLDTIRTTPNIWLVLGIGAAGLFLFADRRDTRRNK